MLETAGADPGSVDTWDLAFRIAPRLNAAGRLGKASTACDLLKTSDSRRAFEIAQHLEEQNNQRKDIEQRILDQYQRWKGTRHRLGGSGSQGIDCSGFVRVVYRDAFNISLPRTTKAQVHEGKSVALSELQPGDLVFFKPPDYPRHVGIYLNGSKFVHASKSKGVTISKIDKYYWGKYFWTARRIIPAYEN